MFRPMIVAIIIIAFKIKKKFLNSKIWGLNITRPFFEEKIIKDLLIEKVNSGLKQIN